MDESGTERPYDSGSGRNIDRFGFVAYPEIYGVGGRKTFIISQENRVYSRDLEGDTIDVLPLNPVEDGWAVHH